MAKAARPSHFHADGPMKSNQRILILGLGGVGRYLATQLADEGHAITVIESSAKAIRRADGNLDVRLVQGDAMSNSCWIEAAAAGMDYLIAVTDDDAVNVLAAMIADRFGVRRKIARVRSRGLWSDGAVLTPDDLRIDLVIQPEELAAQEVAKLLTMRWGNSVIDLAEGAVQVVGARITQDSVLADLQVKDVSRSLEDLPFRLVAIGREGLTLIPGGDERILGGDYAYFLVREEDLPSLMLIAGLGAKSAERVMIIGGGEVGARVAELLKGSFRLKLVEKDENRAEQLSQQLKGVEILVGDGADVSTLRTAGLLRMDAVITATGDNEVNIMTGVLAKQMIRNQTGDRHGTSARAVALVQREQYLTLASAIGVDIVLNKKVIAGDTILSYILKGEMLSASRLHGVDAEVVELVAGRQAPITRHSLAELPKRRELEGRAVIGCVFQGGRWQTASGSTQVRVGDRVVAVCRPDALPDLERLVLG